MTSGSVIIEFIFSDSIASEMLTPVFINQQIANQPWSCKKIGRIFLSYI